ncbi:MAG: hypothetical protein AB1331_05325 [Bacillota bacterium]
MVSHGDINRFKSRLDAASRQAVDRLLSELRGHTSAYAGMTLGDALHRLGHSAGLSADSITSLVSALGSHRHTRISDHAALRRLIDELERRA